MILPGHDNTTSCLLPETFCFEFSAGTGPLYFLELLQLTKLNTNLHTFCCAIDTFACFVLVTDTSWELTLEIDECSKHRKSNKKKHLSMNQNCLFLDQYCWSENGRYTCKNPVLVFFLWPYLNMVKMQVLKAYLT